MRTVTMCFSLWQVPKGRINTLVNCCWESFYSFSRSSGKRQGFRLLSSNVYGHEGQYSYSKRWTRRPITTETQAGKKVVKSCKLSKIRHEVLEANVSPSTNIIINKTDTSGFQEIQYCDIRKEISEIKNLAELLTIIVFDFETTGVNRKVDLPVEFASLDTRGGENSTFQTLVNPERCVPNSHIHGITTQMVCRPDVPRMVDLIPIFLNYVKSREKPGGYVMFVAHNARVFDVPFLMKEFSRCSYEIPENWRFLDTLCLARELIKSGGSNLPSGTSLQTLREYYGIPLVGSAHRAMSDVNVLALVLQRLTFDLKLSLGDLVERSFTPLDLINDVKKKKKAS